MELYAGDSPARLLLIVCTSKGKKTTKEKTEQLINSNHSTWL